MIYSLYKTAMKDRFAFILIIIKMHLELMSTDIVYREIFTATSSIFLLTILKSRGILALPLNSCNLSYSFGFLL